MTQLQIAVVLILDPQLRKSPVGKTLLMLDSGLALLYLPSELHRIWGLSILVSPYFAWYYLGTILLVGTAVWWRTIILALVQWRRRGAPAEPASSDPADLSHL
jgi:hypothetical protein